VTKKKDRKDRSWIGEILTETPCLSHRKVVEVFSRLVRPLQIKKKDRGEREYKREEGVRRMGDGSRKGGLSWSF